MLTERNINGVADHSLIKEPSAAIERYLSSLCSPWNLCKSNSPLNFCPSGLKGEEGVKGQGWGVVTIDEGREGEGVGTVDEWRERAGEGTGDEGYEGAGVKPREEGCEWAGAGIVDEKREEERVATVDDGCEGLEFWAGDEGCEREKETKRILGRVPGNI